MAGFVSVDGVALWVADEGAGDPPMLFVHGSACDSRDWATQLGYFKQTHRVLAADLRGHGRSGVPASGYGAHQLAGDLAALLDRLGCPPVVAVGHSLGGLVVSALAVRWPRLVRALVCVDPAYLVPDETPQVLGAMAAEHGGDLRRLNAAILRRVENRETSGQAKRMRRQRLTEMPEQGFKDLLGNAHWATRSKSEELVAGRACPVLSLHTTAGRADLETPLFADSRSRAVSWDGCGHWPHQERSAEFNQLVEDWLVTID